MPRHVIGLDVGTFSVKVLHLEAKARSLGYEVLAYAEKPLADFAKPNEENSLSDLQTRALAALKEADPMDASWVITGLPGVEGQVRTLDVPFGNQKKIAAVLPGLLDAQLPFGVENLAYSWFSKAKPGQEGVEVAVGFSRKEGIKDYLSTLRSAHIDPRILTLRAAALYDLLVHLSNQSPKKDEKDTGLSAIVDIGHQTTSICIGDAQRFEFSRSVLRGGQHVTDLLAQKLKKTVAEAEQLKKTTEVSPQDSASLAQQIMVEGYYPIARELKQTLISVEANLNRKLTKLYLVGGGSKAKGLEAYLTELLQIPVVLLQSYHVSTHLAKGAKLGPESALSLGYALAGAAPKKQQFDFRKDEFAFSGEFDFMRHRIKDLATWALALFALALFAGVVQSVILTKRLNNRRTEQQALCQTIVGRPLMGGACLSNMQDVIAGKNAQGIPERSAVDVYLALAEYVPSQVQVKVTLLDITEQNVKLVGETSNSDNVDALLRAIEKAPCFKDVQKSQVQQSANNQIRFQLDWNLECSGQPAVKRT